MSDLLERVDRAWTRLELAACVGVLMALVGSLVLWVALKGLASKTTDTYIAGYVFRAVTFAVLLGVAGYVSAKRGWAGGVLALAGVGLAWPLRDLGADFFGNIFAWLQDGSLLTWLGGLRGVATRLTLWLALLGASLATASGRHVTIDVATRAFPEAARGLLVRLGGLVAALVCLAGAWGFFDFIAVDAYGAAPGDGVATKAEVVRTRVGRHLRLAGHQLFIDLHLVGRVASGARWDRCVVGEEWNRWLGTSDEVGSQLEADPAATRSPLLSFPQEASRSLLVKDFNLVVPFGLLMLALRFGLWLLRGAPVESPHGAAEGELAAPTPAAAGAPGP